MPDQTTQFRALVNNKAVHKPTSPQTNKNKKNPLSYDVYTKEAYRIFEHITSLKRFLLTIRRPYLSSESHRRHHQSRHNNNKKSTQQQQKEGSLFSLFPSNIQSLTDNERDEIDFQAKVIIRRCMDRIKELEHAEQLRQQQQEQEKQKSFSKFFQSLLASNNAITAEDILALHRSSMTWLLNKRLAEVSELQRNQQEIRLTRELEKSENKLYKSSSSARKVEEDPVYKFNQIDYEDDDEPAFQVDELSQDQMQMLEKENSTMVEELNNTLNEVRNAEKALLEISTLQNELTNHLAAQTAQTDQLYADAIASTERVEQGNVQLIQSRERNRGTRHFTLFFLLMASFVLLFLDWYS